MSQSLEIPQIDLGDMKTMDDFRQAAEEKQHQLGRAIVNAYHLVGFAFIRAPRDFNAQLDDMYDEWEKLFTLNDETKMKYWGGQYKFQRAFTPVDTEQALFCKRVMVNGETKPRPVRNYAENWFVAPEGLENSTRNMAEIDRLPNVWPAEIPNLRNTTIPIHEGLLAMDKYTMQASEPVLGVPDGYFADRSNDAPSLLRLLHYPPVPREEIDSKAKIGACQHTDINDRTWLPHSRSYGPGKGLEVRTRSGEWISGKAPEGYVITQVGDDFQHSTGGYFLSAQHRVESPVLENGNTLGRFSCALFIHPRSDIDLGDTIDLSHLTDHQKHYVHTSAYNKLHKRLDKLGLAEDSKGT